MFDIPIPTLTPPTPQEMFERANLNRKSNPNVFHSWFGLLAQPIQHPEKAMAAIVDNKEKRREYLETFGVRQYDIPKYGTFKLSKSVTLALDFDEWQMLHCDEPCLDGRKVEEFNTNVGIAVTQADMNYPVFVKFGLFSNKFDFDNCIIEKEEDFYLKLFNIHYAAALFGVEMENEIVIRELIPNRKTDVCIHHKMPLNDEFRAFVKFSETEPLVLDVLNYWHDSIKEQLPKGQDVILDAYNEQNRQYHAQLRDKIKSKLETELKQENGLFAQFNRVYDGDCWSVDFLVDTKGTIWLIDMAVAHQSWGVHLLDEENQKLIQSAT